MARKSHISSRRYDLFLICSAYKTELVKRMKKNELFLDQIIISTLKRSVIIFSLLAVQKVIIHDKHCFELYGYDVLIDVDYNAILLEVNSSPSLTANIHCEIHL